MEGLAQVASSRIAVGARRLIVFERRLMPDTRFLTIEGEICGKFKRAVSMEGGPLPQKKSKKNDDEILPLVAVVHPWPE
jgi:hypothetical protein